MFAFTIVSECVYICACTAVAEEFWPQVFGGLVWVEHYIKYFSIVQFCSIAVLQYYSITVLKYCHRNCSNVRM